MSLFDAPAPQEATLDTATLPNFDHLAPAAGERAAAGWVAH